jgi:DNA-binding Lrp family transcriptional regulator
VSHLQKRIKIKLLKIFNALKSNGSLHIRGIARFTNMHPATVSSIISRLNYFFDIENIEVVPGFRAKIIRLKNPDIKIEDVERYLEVRKQIRGI